MYLKGNSKIKEKFFKENSYTEIRKTYFLAPKLGVDLYMGSTYTRVNTVCTFILPYFVAFLILSGIALSIRFSISWSEISANGRDAIVFLFPHIVNSRFSLAIDNCRLSADTSNIANQIHGFMIDYQ